MTEESKPLSGLELYAAEIARLNEVVAEDAVKRAGSFSDRNPALGKMQKCVFCGQRRRAGALRNGLPCCNSSLTESGVGLEYEHIPAFISSNKWTWNQIGPEEGNGQWEITPRAIGEPTHSEYEAKFGSKRRKPRLSRNRPPLFEMHQLLKRWEVDENLVEARKLQDQIEGLPHFFTPRKPVELAGLAAFAERFITRRNKLRARAKRQQQQLARRINFGLV